MDRASKVRICLFAALLSASGSAASAQTVGSPLTPRGSFFIRLHPSATTLSGIYGAEGNEELPLGSSFQFPSLGTADVPALASTADRISALSGLSSTPSLRLGRVEARFSGDERVVPIQLSYGVLDRLSVGVTVPFIRKRLETLVRLTPEGAELGLNPREVEPRAVTTFLSEADDSLASVRALVEGRCVGQGEHDAGCISGRTLVSDAEAFLADLDAAYADAELFPLAGSEVAGGITLRWDGLKADFGDLGIQGPEAPPLPSRPVDQDTLESLVLSPAWPAGGFPMETPAVALGLGDVEVNAAVALLRPDPPPAERDAGSRLRIYLTALGTFRFATGAPDSLRTVSPIDPPRGVRGFSAGTVADILFFGPLSRLALQSTVVAGWNASREMTLLAPPGARVFGPDENRAEVLWSPGGRIHATVTPRLRVASGLSIGAGWHFLRWEPDEFEPLGDSFAVPNAAPATESPHTQYRVAFELRYTAMEPPVTEVVPFPFELLFRASKSVAGTEGAAVEARAEAMVRFRIRE